MVFWSLKSSGSIVLCTTTFISSVQRLRDVFIHKHIQKIKKLKPYHCYITFNVFWTEHSFTNAGYMFITFILLNRLMFLLKLELPKTLRLNMFICHVKRCNDINLIKPFFYFLHSLLVKKTKKQTKKHAYIYLTVRQHNQHTGEWHQTQWNEVGGNFNYRQ